MPEAVSTETPIAVQSMSAAEHYAAAEGEFAKAQQLSKADPDEYRRVMDCAAMHLRFAEVLTCGASLVIDYALAKESPAYRDVKVSSAGWESSAWNELLGRTRGTR
ncbi:hypothetical protein [Amycolatopsis sp. cmx-11-51]|jgi:hypothetical protein|uniref:hypothetical protein n=1 Tax=Amycolatopsis sp. cmx-11-51 TaxID=2785797 RepID=UPI0039E61E9B